MCFESSVTCKVSMVLDRVPLSIIYKYAKLVKKYEISFINGMF